MAESKKKTVRIAAVSDIHCGRRSQGTLQALFAQVAEQADVLLLPGDLTDYGLAEEAHILVKELTAAHNLPTIAVLGNHDFESGQEQEVVQILCDAGRDDAGRRGVRNPRRGLRRLQGLCRRLRSRRARLLGRTGDQGVRARGAGRGAQAGVGAGPPAHPAADRRAALRPGAWRPSRASRRRFSPSWGPAGWRSRWAATRWRPSSTATRTTAARKRKPATGTPVYNVALPLLRRHFPDRPPFHLFEVTIDTGAPAVAAVGA